jgi:putative lipoic acid-binding regulatory protein
MTDTSDQKSIDSVRSTLDANYEWPCLFPFKFIVPKEHTETVLALFTVDPVRAKESSSGRFTAYTMEVQVASSDEVLAIYARVTQVPNVISL